MSTCHSLRSHSSFKKVLTKLENSYQTHVNTYKSHTLATCHRGTGQPLEKDPNPQDQDIDIPNDYQHEDIGDFENIKNEDHTQLRDLTNKVDHLQHKIEVTEGQPTEAITHLECEVHRLPIAPCPSAPPEPLDEVLQQYTETLCMAQKKNTFMNTLLQDLTIFNGSNSSQLKDWLIDIETAAYFTSETRTKLAQPKSKGLIHTLISEAHDSDKSWEEIKDVLHLKICNLDIHTSVSHFIEIQWKEKESLAAYIHRFKREAKRCNFTNNAATIHIFVKGLKNAHTLAAHVYEKGPQTISDAISEVEKLQAAQQLTATLLPSSTVSMMSNKGNQCFQCQELGHSAHHHPNIRHFDCDESDHVAADCPDRIPPSGTPAHPKRYHSNTRHHTRSTSRHYHRDRHRYNRSRSQSHSCNYQSHSQNSPHSHLLQIIPQMPSQKHFT